MSVEQCAQAVYIVLNLIRMSQCCAYLSVNLFKLTVASCSPCCEFVVATNNAYFLLYLTCLQICAMQVVYYGETAYWVSVDVDVPLFLPLYGERRLHDLRLIAQQEVCTL
jgi:hypothetical protein